MRKLILLVTFVAACVALSLPGTAFADTVLSVSSPATVSQGDTFTVDVDIAGVTDLFAYQLDLGFNPNVLQATGTITEGTFFQSGGGFVPGGVDNTAGAITFNANTLIGPISGLNGGGQLIVFEFMALAPGTSGLDLANIILLDSSLNEIAFTAADGSVVVTGGGPTPTPEASTFLLLGVGVLALATVAARRAVS
jgi:general secretion pathway protein D